MNQKEYELIGNTIALTYSARTNEQRKLGIRDVALDLAYRLQSEYPNFDREKFLRGCGFYSDRIPAALLLANGGYAVAVLTRNYSENYDAFVYDGQRGEFTEAGALQRAQDTISAGTDGWLNDNWSMYTNAPASPDWFKSQGFTLAN